MNVNTDKEEGKRWMSTRLMSHKGQIYLVALVSRASSRSSITFNTLW